MALTSSGTLAIGTIQTEFGGSNPASLNEYYRGGSYVPPLTINAGIPTSGAIQIDDFYSTGTDIDMDSSYSVSDIQVTPATASISVTCYNNGNLVGSGATSSFSDTWVSASSAPGSYYECYLEVLSGSAPDSGTYGSWISLSSDRTWTLSLGTVGTLSGSWRLHIRCAATGTTKDTTDITAGVSVLGGK